MLCTAIHAFNATDSGHVLTLNRASLSGQNDHLSNHDSRIIVLTASFQMLDDEH